MSISDSVEQLRADVARIARPEGRSVGAAGHERARRDLVERLHGLGLAPYDGDAFDLPYEAAGRRFSNVVARLPGSDPSLAPVLIAAHYDTAGAYAGADDNAAAMAIALGCADDLRARALARDVLFAFFDAEEPPYFLSDAMGSVHFYRHQRKGPIHCALVMDLVGHDVPIPGFEDLLFLTGIESDPGLAAAIEAADTQSLRLIPTLNSYVGDLSDHHVFRVNRRPYLFLSCAHWEHYHRATDTPEKLNYVKMAHIRAFLTDLTQAVSRVDLEGPFEGADTVPVEVAYLKRSLGPLIEMLGLPLGSRQDIDRAARLLMMQFGL